jgi:uncharacterized membrane-anchored protein YitT (DUF2179 family)
MLVVNLVLLGVAVSLRGWRYGARTVYGMVTLSVAIDGLAPFLPNLVPDDTLLAVLYGGAIVGLGLGLVFKAGGNTGGTSIIAQLLLPKVPLSVGQIMLMAYGWGGGVAAVNDLVQEGLSVERAAFIMSDRSEEMARAILTELDRGATGLSGRGLYSGSEREVILTVVARNEIDRLKAIVRAVDPSAFLIITDVHEAVGEGFREMGAHHG